MALNRRNLINELIAQVRAIAEARPKNVYLSDAGCNYADGKCSDGTIGCLLGQALLTLGFSIQQLRRIDDISVSSIAIALQTLLGVDELPMNQVRWLRRVQDAQDLELEWGAAVEAADMEVPL